MDGVDHGLEVDRLFQLAIDAAGEHARRWSGRRPASVAFGLWQTTHTPGSSVRLLPCRLSTSWHTSHLAMSTTTRRAVTAAGDREILEHALHRQPVGKRPGGGDIAGGMPVHHDPQRARLRGGNGDGRGDGVGAGGGARDYRRIAEQIDADRLTEALPAAVVAEVRCVLQPSLTVSVLLAPAVNAAAVLMS